MSTRTIPTRPPSADGGDPPWRDGDDGDFTPPPRRPRRRLVTPLTGALVAVLIAALGFLAGVEVQKSSGSSATAAAGTRPTFAGAPPSGAFPGGGQAGGQGTTGTVSSIKGGVLYVKDSDGTTLEVKVSDSTKVTRTAATTAGKVHPGDTVTVQGKTSGATVTATSVTATASN